MQGSHLMVALNYFQKTCSHSCGYSFWRIRHGALSI